MKEPHPPIHLRLRGKIDQATERLALRTVLNAAHLLGLAAGTHLRQTRGSKDPLADMQARLDLAELRARLAWEAVEILTERFSKIHEKRRPFYNPIQRFRILEIKSFLAWSADRAAKVFLVCPHTILNWERSADPHAKTVGSTVKPGPPIQRAADVVRALVQVMSRLGFGGPDLLARILTRAGWEISASSVQRYRREKAILPACVPPPQARKASPVKAGFAHHTWMLDVSEVRQFLGSPLHIAAVFDAFSRVPLVLQVFDKKPAAKDLAGLLRRAAKAFARPKYVITDLGGEFTGGAFKNAVERLAAVQRFAAADSIKATAQLERFWRTLKQLAGLRALGLPLDRNDLEHRLQTALLFYIVFRPHEGLNGATPGEAFLGLEPAHKKAAKTPRGRPGEGPTEAPFRIEFLDAEQRLAVLKHVE